PRIDRVNLPHLRTLYYAGSPISLEVLKRAIATFGPVLFQIFGLTESGPPITCLRKAEHVLDGDERHLRRLQSCGIPFVDVDVRVARADGSDVAVGEVGEVICRSTMLMKGYWRQPEATAEVLRDGWLYTGDLAKVDQDGYLYIVDRKKDVIISGSANI